MGLKNKVQLITYPDSLGGDLQSLNHVLDTYFPEAFQGGIHILPPFPSSGDRGFAPITYLEIEPAFGTWEDIQALAQSHAIMLDLMVNHISAKSAQFLDFLERGLSSDSADLFLPIDKLWPGGDPSREEIEKIFCGDQNHIQISRSRQPAKPSGSGPHSEKPPPQNRSTWILIPRQPGSCCGISFQIFPATGSRWCAWMPSPMWSKARDILFFH